MAGEIFDVEIMPFAAVACLITVCLVVPITKKLAAQRACNAYIKSELKNNWRFYDDLLCRKNNYYKELSATNKAKFLYRLLHFQYTKEFEYLDITASPEMPVLISAAAIQLTFGLEHYLLDFFKHIYVLQNDYYYGYSKMPFQGHVNKFGIYLSWSNFMKGFENYSDGQNVGLHEMAHALAYTNFVAEEDIDNDFIERFKVFSRTGRRIFDNMQFGESNMLDQYAATNYNEFWAVSVETFFEKPRQLQLQMPELYEALSYLLNQDLLQGDEVLVRALA